MSGLVSVRLGSQSPRHPEHPDYQEPASAGSFLPGEEESEGKAAAVADAMGAKLAAQFEQWRTARQTKEEEWVEDLRAYSGIEDQADENHLSDVFVHLTRTKVQVAFSRIVDLLFQTSDKHWSVGPTPVPRLEQSQKEALASMLVQLTGMMPTPEQVDKVAQKAAAMKAEAMEREMEDQMVEADYERKLKEAILEACILGSGAIKGVTVGVRQDQRWRQVENLWDIELVETPVPVMNSVSIFDLYPDPMALSMDEAEGVYERHVLTRHAFKAQAEQNQFDPEAVEWVLRANPKGNFSELQHERDRRTIAGLTLSSEGLVPRFELLEYWGYLSGQDLAECGCETDEPGSLYLANVWTCAGRTLKAMVVRHKPNTELPYRIFPYEKVPHQFWGIGVARQMRDSQEVLNAAVRTMLDNLAIASGPQVEVNTNLLAPGEDPRDVRRWKVWLRDGGDPAYPAVRFYQPNVLQGAVTEVIDLFKRFADEETNMPSYTHGMANPGLNKTASGMSMLMGAANVAVKSIVRNIDAYLIEPLVKGLYHWNMQWNEDESIKGDMEVYARGSTALIAKEVQSERMLQFAQMTANPIDMQLVDRIKILRSVAESMDIDPDKVMRDEEEFQGFADPGGPGGVAPGGLPGMGGAPGLPGAMPGALPG